MSMKKMLVAAALVSMVAVAGGFGYSTFRFVVPWLFVDEQAEAILVSIRANLESVGTVTADVDCVADDAYFDFVDGALAARGETDFRLDQGTKGEVYWRNGIAFNHYTVSRDETSGLRWDDPDPECNAFAAWGGSNGIVDVRVPLGMAELHPVGMTLDPETHVVSGVDCHLLVSAGLRLYVDAAHQHLIKN